MTCLLWFHFLLINFLKPNIQDFTDKAIFDCEDIPYFEKYDLRDPQILITRWIRDSLYQYCIAQQDAVKKHFEK